MSLTNTPTNAPPLFCFDASATFLGHSDLSRSTRYRISLFYRLSLYSSSLKASWLQFRIKLIFFLFAKLYARYRQNTGIADRRWDFFETQCNIFFIYFVLRFATRTSPHVTQLNIHLASFRCKRLCRRSRCGGPLLSMARFTTLMDDQEVVNFSGKRNY